MAQRKDRRARSRKRRASTGNAGRSSSGPTAVAAPKKTQEAWQESVSQARSTGAPRRQGPARAQRPRPPWHPLPLSEIVILVGTLGFVIGLRRGPSTSGKTPLLLGVAAVALGTIEFMLREHRSGFRSHTVLLSLLPVVVFHTVVVVIISAFTPVTQPINLAVLVVDVALFAVLFRLLRVRYGEARYRQLTGDRHVRSARSR